MKRITLVAAAAALTLFMIALLTFFLMHLIPGDPFIGDKALPPEVLANLQRKFHLDLPWWQQFLLYIRDALFSFDLGPSITQEGRTVNEIIAEGLPISLELGFYAMIVAIVTGVVLGTIAAAYRGTWIDFSAMFVAISGVSLPSFFVAALVILIFAQYLQILPAAFWDGPSHRILPSLVLGLRPAAIIARITRSSVLEVAYQDYVRTAHAKGLARKVVLFKHVLRNAMVPVITVIGPMAATVLTGSFVIESVFSIPGIASQFINSVRNRDYPVIMGVTMVYACFLLAANLLVDIVYTWIDPRMRQEAK